MIKKKNFSSDIGIIKNHFLNLYKINNYKFEKGCGSYLFDGFEYIFSKKNYSKQKLLYEKALNKKNILEIGTYMGHSALIMLVANPHIRLVTIDINDLYSKKSINYLKKKFPKAKIKFLHGESIKQLSILNDSFDLFHIDGSHKDKIITKEFNYCKKLRNTNTLEIIFDDDITCQDLIKNISKTYNIIEKTKKGRGWVTNMYIKIQFDNFYINNILQEIKFIIRFYFSYIMKKIYKLIKLEKI